MFNVDQFGSSISSHRLYDFNLKSNNHCGSFLILESLVTISSLIPGSNVSLSTFVTKPALYSLLSLSSILFLSLIVGILYLIISHQLFLRGFLLPNDTTD